ncbi:MAG TPA: phosphoribosylaminoimidazolesuccinocarboxamide synthase [Myxococcaceae bacterium]|nr:phosphoribosylaminoimidazolesuccinocarboxamide synthase [Myxococcaceae bacterium]
MSDPALRAQLDHTLSETRLDALGSRYRGKVRDVYRAGDRLFLVATDRLSAFDRVLTTIPFKGEVLNRLAQFWFERTAHVVRNHVLDVPDPNVTVARATQPFAIEVVVRGYLTGSLWRDVQKGAHAVYGVPIAAGMRKDEAFPTPILTPSTKAAPGEHDAPLSEVDVLQRGLATEREWGAIREAALGLFREGQAWARTRGLFLVDTKYEFGKVGSTLYVIDEMHTPDSSRYWRAAEYEARLRKGEDQAMLDKETVRQWLIREKGFSGHGPLPVIPEEIRIRTAETYLAAYEEITGAALPLVVGDVEDRIRRNLTTHGYLA